MADEQRKWRGLLDRLFLRHLSKKGKKAYWIGQVMLAVLLGLWSLVWPEYWVLLVAALGFASGWGMICMSAWPRSDDEPEFAGGGVWCPACLRRELQRDRCMVCGGALEDMPG